MKRPAFTILELLVVMSIIAVLLSIGIGGMSLFRDGVSFEQGVAEFRSTLRSARNMARNSVLPPELFDSLVSDPNFDIQNVAGVAIYFTSKGDYNLRYCLTTGVANSYDCRGLINSSPRSELYRQVVFTPKLPECKVLVFQRLSGDIFAIADLQGAVSSLTKCEVDTSLRLTNLKGNVVIDLTQDTIL